MQYLNFLEKKEKKFSYIKKSKLKGNEIDIFDILICI